MTGVGHIGNNNYSAQPLYPPIILSIIGLQYSFACSRSMFERAAAYDWARRTLRLLPSSRANETVRRK